MLFPKTRPPPSSGGNMAKKKVKIVSPVDLSEHVVEVDAATPLPLGAEPVTDNELYKAWNSAPPGKMVPYRPETWSQEKDREREDEARRYGGYELRKIPEGMNKFNSTNEWLMLILESLYRIERKLGA